MTTYNKPLLLAMMVVGVAVITSNAYAQSNTERLASLVEDSDVIRTTLDAISEVLGSIQSSLVKIVDSVQNTEAISARVESAMVGYGATMIDVSDGIGDLGSILGSMSSDISDIKSALTDQSGDGLAKNIEVLTSTVNRNEISVSERLDRIEASIERLEKSTSGQSSGVSSSALTGGGSLTQKSATINIDAYTYKSEGTMRGNVYILEIPFSCDGPVSIDTVGTNLNTGVTWILPTSNPSSSTDENYLTVDGRELYNSRFEISAGSYQVFNRDVDFGLAQLASGQSLQFVSQQHDIRSKISSSSSDSVGYGYTITVSYLGSSDVKCSLGASASTSASLPKSAELVMRPDVTTGGLFNTFSTGVTCADDPVEITSLAVTSLEGWNGDLARFATIVLTLDDSDTSHAFSFASSGALNAYAGYPIKFSDEDITISGSMPGTTRVLVEMDYNTVNGGECIEDN